MHTLVYNICMYGALLHCQLCARARAFRERQLAKLIDEVTAQIRALDARAVITPPVFGDSNAHGCLTKWVPEIVAAVVS